MKMTVKNIQETTDNDEELQMQVAEEKGFVTKRSVAKKKEVKAQKKVAMVTPGLCWN